MLTIVEAEAAKTCEKRSLIDCVGQLFAGAWLNDASVQIHARTMALPAFVANFPFIIRHAELLTQDLELGSVWLRAGRGIFRAKKGMWNAFRL